MKRWLFRHSNNYVNAAVVTRRLGHQWTFVPPGWFKQDWRTAESKQNLAIFTVTGCPVLWLSSCFLMGKRRAVSFYVNCNKLHLSKSVIRGCAGESGLAIKTAVRSINTAEQRLQVRGSNKDRWQLSLGANVPVHLLKTNGNGTLTNRQRGLANYVSRVRTTARRLHAHSLIRSFQELSSVESVSKGKQTQNKSPKVWLSEMWVRHSWSVTTTKKAFSYFIAANGQSFEDKRLTHLHRGGKTLKESTTRFKNQVLLL